MRIIPKNTKVATEFFTGVSLSDIVVGTVGVLLILLVVLSNLPYKVGICGAILAVFVLLLVRIETEANYMFLLRIVKHFSYHRSYRKLHGDLFEEMEESEITVISREVKAPKEKQKPVKEKQKPSKEKEGKKKVAKRKLARRKPAKKKSAKKIEEGAAQA